MKRPTVSRLLCAAALSLLCCCAPAPRALAAEGGAEDFEAAHAYFVYDNAAGMPFSEANAVAQTPDGFLYIASYGGLTRYDGRRFQSVEGISSAVSLYVDRSGRLWVGTNDMGAVCLDGDELRVYGAAEGLPSLSVRGIREDPDGNILFATTYGMAYLEPSGALRLLEDEAIQGAYVAMLSDARDGTICAATANGNVFTINALRVSRYLPAHTLGADVGCVYPDPKRDGYVYFGTEGSELLYGALDAPISTFVPLPLKGVTGVNSLAFAGNRVWVCADNGLGFLDGGVWHRLEHAPVNNLMESAAVDAEGNVWCASSRRGVMKISQSVFTDLSAIAGLEDRVVNATWLDRGTLYVGTDSGLVILDGRYRRVSSPVSELLGTERIRSVLGDRKGRLWFCTYGERGLVCYHPDSGAYRCYTRADGLASEYVRDAIELSDGAILVSALGGVCRIEGDEITASWDADDGMANTTILSMCEAEPGTVYLGSNGDGIYVLDGGALRRFDGGGALKSGIILRLKEDTRRGCIWVITGDSELAYLRDGTLHAVQSLPERDASPYYDILFADDGSLWLMGGSGICVLNGDALLSGETPETDFYNMKRGLPHITTSNSRTFISADGDAYIAGNNGLTFVNVNVPRASTVAPALTIPYIEVDDARVRIPSDGRVLISKDAKHADIYAYALTFLLHDPKVSYCLEGFDDAETVSTARELPVVRYTNLPGGEYAFRFSAAGSETGFTLVKEKALHEHAAFWIGIAALGLLLFALLVRVLLWRQKKELDRKHEEERINSELGMAAKIQSDMLPSVFPAFPDRSEFSLYATMRPAKEVGGDFYDFFLIDGDHLALAVADVSGKGVPAALFMTISKTLLKNAAIAGLSPSRVMEEVNEKLCASNKNNMFVTVWLGVYEISTGKLTYADAGHEKPLLYHDGKWAFLPKHNGVALAMLEPELLELDDDPPFVDETIHLEPGDVVMQYTDGVPEATDAKEELFGDERAARCDGGVALRGAGGAAEASERRDRRLCRERAAVR